MQKNNTTIQLKQRKEQWQFIQEKHSLQYFSLMPVRVWCCNGIENSLISLSSFIYHRLILFLIYIMNQWAFSLTQHYRTSNSINKLDHFKTLLLFFPSNLTINLGKRFVWYETIQLTNSIVSIILNKRFINGKVAYLRDVK